MSDVEFEKLKTAADGGDADAQYKLGTMYIIGGDDAPQDYYVEAFKYYKMAAEGGHRYAKFMMVNMYATGSGTTQSSDDAKKWLKSIDDRYE